MCRDTNTRRSRAGAVVHGEDNCCKVKNSTEVQQNQTFVKHSPDVELKVVGDHGEIISLLEALINLVKSAKREVRGKTDGVPGDATSLNERKPNRRQPKTTGAEIPENPGEQLSLEFEGAAPVGV